MYQKFASALPLILILWLLVNIAANFIVKAWRKAQYQAAGKEMEEEEPKRLRKSAKQAIGKGE